MFRFSGGTRSPRSVIPQDHMAWETQGPVANRTVEHLSYSDRGVVLLRRVMKEQIERVRQGLDPMGVQRDPDHEMINTNIDEDWWQRGGRGSVNEGKPMRKKVGARR